MLPSTRHPVAVATFRIPAGQTLHVASVRVREVDEHHVRQPASPCPGDPGALMVCFTQSRRSLEKRRLTASLCPFCAAGSGWRRIRQLIGLTGVWPPGGPSPSQESASGRVQTAPEVVVSVACRSPCCGCSWLPAELVGGPDGSGAGGKVWAPLRTGQSEAVRIQTWQSSSGWAWRCAGWGCWARSET